VLPFALWKGGDWKRELKNVQDEINYYDDIKLLGYLLTEENNMKKIFAAMLIVFMAVGSAYAVDISVTGNDKIRGNYYDNISSVDSNSDRGTHMFYDHEIDIDPTINISDATSIYIQMELNDATWTASNQGHTSGDVNDDVRVEYIYANHTFSTGTQFQGGQMPVGQWGYKFGDSEDPGWRLRVNQPLGGGTLIGILQKIVEAQDEGLAPVEGENSESKDADAYLLGWSGKAGDITIQPLIYYVQNGTANTDLGSSDTDNTWVLDMAADGQHGMLGWEAEFIYMTTTMDGTNAVAGNDVDDQNVWGAYAGVNFNLGAVTPGLKIAYGSYSKDDGSFSYGTDYDAGQLMIFDEDVGFGPGVADPTTEDIKGATTVMAYADFNVNDALSFYGGLAYLMSNSSDDGPWKDASAYELDIKGAYKITENVSYHVDCGYASIDWDSDPRDATVTDNPDGITKIQHYLKIEF
jgi:hypothetical protein